MPKRKPRDPERSPDLPHNWIERQLDRLAGFVYFDPVDIDPWEYRSTKMSGPGVYDYLEEWRTINLGEQWGGKNVTGFFKKKITIPESHGDTGGSVDTVLDIFMDGGETQLFIDGRPWQGLDWNRSIIPLEEYAEPGREIDLSMEAFIINYPYDERRNDEREMHTFERARLLKRDRKLEQVLFDARFVLENYVSYWKSDDNLEIEAFLLKHLEDAARYLGPEITTREEARAGAAAAEKVLREKIYESGAFGREGTFNICAQSHIDLVYLWPLKETLRKNVRTATNQLSLMREYPDYKFTSSQPYLFEKIKEMYPETYQEIKQRVKEGRWEIIGATWIEPDGNLLGPESLVRQILFGKRFLRDEFGLEAESCWLPDVFGVMYTLPQILRKTGVKYFSTEKLNVWNDSNVFPHDTFLWRGPDGSEVISHFAPTHFGQNYEAGNLKKHWELFREKNSIGENLFIYGWSDGGGGPTREMVESSLRSKKFPGLPKGRIDFAEDYFRRIEHKADVLEVWDDELYMEGHRGTYTSKGELKRRNRKAEILYRDAEILGSLATLFGGPRFQEEINSGWKLVLLNQFHDNITGTHVPECMPGIREDSDLAFSVGEKVKTTALEFIAGGLEPCVTEKSDLLLFNTISWERGGLISVEGKSLPGWKKGIKSLETGASSRVPVQLHDGKLCFSDPGLPVLGWKTVSFSEEDPTVYADDTAAYGDGSIETPFYILRFDEEGKIESLFDKQNNREVLAGSGNEFQVFEDDPGRKFSAWDIAYHFEEFRYPVEQTIGWHMVANGPCFAAFKSEWKVLESVITQEMRLYQNDRRIDFITKADWKDSKKLFKVAFPVKVRSKGAWYDLPFGNIERPTHRNTNWEKGRFEVCGHKWADLSEGNYGVALMNDCKYGYDIREHVMRLSLLRSPVRPTGQSDIGEHEFTYSLFPHGGTWREASVDRKAYELNIPVLYKELGKAVGASGENPVPEYFSFLNLDSSSVIVEALKQQEDGNGIVLRTFDSHGCHGKAGICSAVDFSSVRETDLLEENPFPVKLENGKDFSPEYTPWEIKTHLLTIKQLVRAT